MHRMVFEDDQILVVDKPSGMVVNRSKSAKGETVQDWVEKNCQFATSQDHERRNGIVHRIDKETSGVLLIAKTPVAFSGLQQQFKKREVEKVYTALVHGRVKPQKGSIKAAVGRLPWNRERFGVLAGGREAETGYKAVRNYQLKEGGEELTLLEVYPKTGRTHQIRVHLKSIGHPIVGDGLYAGRKTARADRSWCPRLFLHAAKLSFVNPKTGKRVVVEAPLPEELKKVLGKLQKVD